MSGANSHQRFTDLNVWKVSRAFKLQIYELVKLFPPEEKYGLTSQLVRSARSVCSNISEGHGRFTYKDQLHFCIQSRGSLSESLNHLIDAYDCKYIDSDTLKKLEEAVTNVEKLLNGYISFLRNTGSNNKSNE